MQPYEEWTVTELRKRAAELGIEGRSYMKKARLVRALREHGSGRAATPSD